MAVNALHQEFRTISVSQQLLYHPTPIKIRPTDERSEITVGSASPTQNQNGIQFTCEANCPSSKRNWSVIIRPRSSILPLLKWFQGFQGTSDDPEYNNAKATTMNKSTALRTKICWNILAMLHRRLICN